MLSEKIKEIREREGLTQDEFAREIFVSRTTVTKWETGKSLPNIDTLKLISKKYGVSIDELIHNEAESGFYKGGKQAFGNVELTRKQKIIACVVFFLIAGTFFVTITVKQIRNSPTVIEQEALDDYNEIRNLAPEIIGDWAEERGYWFRTIDFSPIIGVISSMESFTYEIFEKEEDKNGDRYLYRLEFAIIGNELIPSIRVGGDNLGECVDRFFEKLEEENDLIAKFGGETADIDFIKEKFEESTGGDVSSIEDSFEDGYFSVGGSTFDLMIIDESSLPKGFKSMTDGQYKITCNIFSNYRLDKMEADMNR